MGVLDLYVIITSFRSNSSVRKGNVVNIFKYYRWFWRRYSDNYR